MRGMVAVEELSKGRVVMNPQSDERLVFQVRNLFMEKFSCRLLSPIQQHLGLQRFVIFELSFVSFLLWGVFFLLFFPPNIIAFSLKHFFSYTTQIIRHNAYRMSSVFVIQVMAPLVNSHGIQHIPLKTSLCFNYFSVSNKENKRQLITSLTLMVWKTDPLVFSCSGVLQNQKLRSPLLKIES